MNACTPAEEERKRARKSFIVFFTPICQSLRLMMRSERRPLALISTILIVVAFSYRFKWQMERDARSCRRFEMKKMGK